MASDILRTTIGDDSIGLAEIFLNLAKLHADCAKFTESLEFIQASRAIFESTNQLKHPLYSSILMEHAIILVKEGKASEGKEIAD